MASAVEPELNDNVVLASPSGELRLAIWLDPPHGLRWSLERRNELVVEESSLAASFAAATFGTDPQAADLPVPSLKILDTGGQVETSFAYQRPSGKARRVDAIAHERTVIVQCGDDSTIALDLIAFDDAVAHRFRQIDPLGAGVESSTIAFPEAASKYVQTYDRAGRVQPASEALYTNAVPIDFEHPMPQGWSLPALFNTPAGWVLVGETAVDVDAVGSRLVNGSSREHWFAPPPEDQFDGPVVEDPTGPVTLPWKVFVAGELADIVATNVFELLATPTSIEDTEWIRPGRVSWSWWSESDSPRNPARLRDFIDFSAEVGWEYSLIDANWNLMPDGTIEDLVSYASERNVGLFLWYNSGGDHNRVTEQPRDRMDHRERRRTEMAWLRKVGIVGLKVDFFHGDRASMNRLSLEMLHDAAEFGLLMNFHGITSPKGWHATWPHLLTTEAVRGAEQYKFDSFFPHTAPRLNTVLPFTRNVVGPMDYTPMTLSDLDHPHATTNTHELALGVVFESGLQHPADSPESYRSLGDTGLDLLRRLPAVWDEVRLLSGGPGDHVVLARRHVDRWWVGGINGWHHPIEVAVDLSEFGHDFLIATDGPTRDDIVFGSATGTVHTVSLAPFGGFVAWPSA